jgi:hypothetical protein
LGDVVQRFFVNTLFFLVFREKNFFDKGKRNLAIPLEADGKLGGKLVSSLTLGSEEEKTEAFD